jgi:hypothetical protein
MQPYKNTHPNCNNPMTTACKAPPGFFCSPLSNRLTICPEHWYCLGGAEPARKCLDGRWSAVQSMYPEDCVDHMGLNMAVLAVLFSSLLFVGICIWYRSWDYKSIKDGHPILVVPYMTRSRRILYNRVDV